MICVSNQHPSIRPLLWGNWSSNTKEDVLSENETLTTPGPELTPEREAEWLADVEYARADNDDPTVLFYCARVEALIHALRDERKAREEAEGKAVAGWHKFHDMREAWEHEKAGADKAEQERELMTTDHGPFRCKYQRDLEAAEARVAVAHEYADQLDAALREANAKADMWKRKARKNDRARKQRDALAAKVARVEALRDEYVVSAAKEERGGELWSSTAAALTAALADKENNNEER